MEAQWKGVETLNGTGEGSMKHGGHGAQQLPLERARASVRAAFLVSGGPDRNARPPRRPPESLIGPFEVKETTPDGSAHGATSFF